MNAALETPFTPEDDASYIEHCAAMLERFGQATTANTLRVIAMKHRELAGPWRGLYSTDRMPERDEYGVAFHPDLPEWPDDEERDTAPLIAAQGFEVVAVSGEGDIPDALIGDGGPEYFAALRAWQPQAPGEGWRLVAVGDTKNGPMAWFVRPRQEPQPAGEGEGHA